MIIMGGTILCIYIYTYMYTTRLTYGEKYGKCMVGSNFFWKSLRFPSKTRDEFVVLWVSR